MVADPVSVPAARRFARDTLEAWQLAELAEDVTLCVSELASNAALHSASPYFDLAMDHQSGAVHISVGDQGVVPAAAVVRSGFPTDELLRGSTEILSATGRGLVILSALASDWGVEATTVGKRVWARLIAPGSDEPVAKPAAASPRPAEETTGLPTGWHVVRLARCPVGLSLRQDRHLDELVRELQLVDGSDEPRPHALVEAIQSLLRGQAHARHLGRRIAQDAAAAGLDQIDIDMPVPAAAAVEVQQLHEAVLRADALCRQEALLTLASDPDIMSLRRWMVHEFVRQIEHADPPQGYADWVGASGGSGTSVEQQRQDG